MIKNLSQNKKIVATHSLQRLAFGIVNIFIPIQLIQIGFELKTVMFFYLIVHSTVLALNLILGSRLDKINPRTCILLALPLAFVFFATMTLPVFINNYWWLAAVLSGIHTGLYWLGLHLLFLQNTQNDSLAKNTSYLESIPKILGMAAPLIAGLVISSFGFGWLLIPVGLALSGAMWFVGHMNARVHSKRVALREVKTILGSDRRLAWSEIFDNLEQETSWLWPTFLFVSSFSIISIGVLESAVQIITIITILIIGQKITPSNQQRWVAITVVAVGGLWLWRLAVSAELFLYIVTIVGGLIMSIKNMTYNGMLYKRISNNTISMIIAREVPTWLGRVIMILIVLIVGEISAWSFAAAAVAAFVVLLIWLPKLRLSNTGRKSKMIT